MRFAHRFFLILLAITGTTIVLATVSRVNADDEWVVYEGGSGPGAGKHIVLVSGDDEYRSEEGLPMLAKILARHHGFRCTVLFAIDPADGTIQPGYQQNIPGLESLKTADLMVLFLRFRELPDEQMKHIVDYVEAGKPIIGLRTATHAFNYDKNKQSPYARYDWRNGEWKGGFGQQVLGDTWISHHGDHGRQSTRGVINPSLKDHPILRGVNDIWGPTDVYGVKNLPAAAQVLVHGQVLAGMKPTDEPLPGPKNDPLMPLAWIKSYEVKPGKPGKAFCTTIGASQDLQSEGLRRLLVNACYWGVGLEEKIDPKSSVAYVGEYSPTSFGFGTAKQGVRPRDHR